MEDSFMKYNWDYFDKYEDLIDKYMPNRGEGDTMASQICTAINKLIYRYFNDGDWYDNTTSGTYGENISDYANWLYNHIPGIQDRMMTVKDMYSGNDYVAVLAYIAAFCLRENKLAEWNTQPKQGSIYHSKWPFVVEDPDYDDDEDDGWYRQRF